jgi:uncharacterized protein YbjT (DUF2867 family)
MRFVVVGATGATGRRVVKYALEIGHEVVAVSRRPASHAAPSNRLVPRAGDVLDPPSLIAAFAGADAVISTIGPTSNLSPGTLMSEGILNILTACRQTGVSRFVMQSGITMTDGSDLSRFDRFALRLIRLVFRKALADKAIAEAAVCTSELDWVIVRPTGLKELPPSGSYTAGPRASVALLRPLSFADCAHCLVRAAEGESGWHRQIVNAGA